MNPGYRILVNVASHGGTYVYPATHFIDLLVWLRTLESLQRRFLDRYQLILQTFFDWDLHITTYEPLFCNHRTADAEFVILATVAIF